MAAPLNYSTKIAVSKTLSEIQKMLAEHGASRIGVDYENAIPVGIYFSLTTGHGDRFFELPVNVDAMRALLISKDRKGELKTGSKVERTSRRQAERVAWRVIKDWLAAQMALVETEMVQMDEIFLPYLRIDAGRTLYDQYRDHEQRAIEGI